MEFSTNIPDSRYLWAELKEEQDPTPYYYFMVFTDYKLRTPYLHVNPMIYNVSATNIVKPNLWQKIIFYIDYNNFEAYIDFPSANYATKIYKTPIYLIVAK